MVGFLTLSHELRQQILLNALTDDDLLEKDLEFNQLLLNVSINLKIMNLINSNIPNTIAAPVELNILPRVADWRKAQKAVSHSMIPAHIATTAADLALVDPQIEEDMGWVLWESMAALAQKLND
jgi:hypothetical protein